METDIKVTSARIYNIENSVGRVKAIASIVINNSICIKGIKIIEDDNGLFIAMPNRKLISGKLEDLVFPINNETRKIIQDAILKEYCNYK